MRLHLFLFLACATVLASDRQDIPYLVAALDSTDPALVEDAQRRLLVVGPEALPLLRVAAEDELTRRAGLLPRIDRLVKELDSDDYERREAAQRDLVDIGAEALTALRGAAANGSAEQAARAQDAIDKIGTGPASPPRFIVQVARAIAAQPDDECVLTLAAIARQPEQPIISCAINGLARLGTPAARQALVLLSADANVDRRWTARAALLRLGEAPTWALDEFLHDVVSDAVSRRVFESLRSWESPDCIRLAIRSVRGGSIPSDLDFVLTGLVGSALLSQEVLAVLGRSELAGQRPRLLSLLRDHTGESIATIATALGDSDAVVRREGILRIATFRPSAARELIEPLLSDKEASVRQAALEALHTIVGREPALFRRALADPDLAPRALEAYLVRVPGADAITRIPDRLEGPTNDESREVERFLAASVDSAWRDAVQTNAEMSHDTKLGCLRGWLYASAATQLGPLPPRPSAGDPTIPRFLGLLALPATLRPDAIRAALHDPEESIRQQAVRWAVYEGCDGIEDEVYPQLLASDSATADFARLYLRRRRSADLVDRVKRAAVGERPGAAARLWVEWEGRTAVEALLARTADGGTVFWERLQALSEGALEEKDAPLLLWRHSTAIDRNGMAAWVGALQRTRAPAARARIAEWTTWTAADSGREEAIGGLLDDAEARSLPIRLARASRGTEEKNAVDWIGLFEGHPSREAASEVVARIDTCSGDSLPHLARALVRCDPDLAKAKAAEWNSSIHGHRRAVALWIDLLQAREPGADTVEALRSAGLQEKGLLLWAAADFGSADLLRACAPLLTDPDPQVREWAWTDLAIGAGGTPDDVRNSFCIPCEARAAWEAWLTARAGHDHAALLRETLGAKGEADLLAAYVRGPWYASAAAWLATRSKDMQYPTEPLEFVDEAARWRDSLR